MPCKIKPGSKSPKSGDYDIVGKQGNVVIPNVTVDKGKTMPPTPKKQQTFQPKKK